MGKGKEVDGKGEGKERRGGEGEEGKDDLHPTLFYAVCGWLTGGA